MPPKRRNPRGRRTPQLPVPRQCAWGSRHGSFASWLLKGMVHIHQWKTQKTPPKNTKNQSRIWGCFLCLADGFGPVIVWPCHHDSYSGKDFFFQIHFVEPQKLARVWRLLQLHHFGESWRTEASWKGQDCLYLRQSTIQLGISRCRILLNWSGSKSSSWVASSRALWPCFCPWLTRYLADIQPMNFQSQNPEFLVWRLFTGSLRRFWAAEGWLGWPFFEPWTVSSTCVACLVELWTQIPIARSSAGITATGGQRHHCRCHFWTAEG